MAHVGAAGQYSFGTRLQGTHEAVRLHPEFWVEADLADDRVEAAFMQRFGYSIAAEKGASS
jgi:hypothetical protein